MKDPKKLAIVYLAMGVLAIAASLYYMSLESSILDWLILGMGAYSIFLGVKQYLQVRAARKPPQE